MTVKSISKFVIPTSKGNGICYKNYKIFLLTFKKYFFSKEYTFYIII